MYVCMYVCIYIYIYIYICMHACMYVCMWVPGGVVVRPWAHNRKVVSSSLAHAPVEMWCSYYPARACAARGYVIGRGVYILYIYILYIVWTFFLNQSL